MFTTQEFAHDYPLVVGILNVAVICVSFAALWVLGRMGDNINKIRKMLEEEIKHRHKF